MQIHEKFNQYKGISAETAIRQAYSMVPRDCGDTMKIAISYKLHDCWQLMDTDTGAIYTPQAFEAKFRYLPPCPPSANKKTRKLYYAHRKSFKGFAPKQKPRAATVRGNGC